MDRMTFISTFSALFLGASSGAASIYVDDNASGDPGPGNPAISNPLENGSAARPFDSIAEAVAVASSGNDVIIILDGTYTGVGNRDINCLGKDLVIESASGNPATVVIDGQGIGRGFYANSGELLELAGMTIRNGWGSIGGGALWLRYGQTKLTNCRFEDCSADYNGGAIWTADQNLIIEACVFSGNFTSDPGSGGGGAIHFYSSLGATISDTSFDENSSLWGGAIGNSNAVSPQILDCTFTNNVAEFGGGAVFLYGLATGSIMSNVEFTGNRVLNAEATGHGGGALYTQSGYPLLTQCTFEGNWIVGLQGDGGAYVSSNGTPTLVQCSFVNNQALINNGIAGGGGMFLSGGGGSLLRCSFEGNVSGGSGGGLKIVDSSPSVTECSFVENTAESFAGGVYYENGTSRFSYCTFEKNDSLLSGGGMYITNDTETGPEIVGAIFAGNTSFSSGAGAYVTGDTSEPLFVNTLFTGNSVANAVGGAVRVHDPAGANGPTRIINCTFNENTSPGVGRSVYSDNFATVIRNSVLWGSSPAQVATPVGVPFGTQLVLEYCVITDGWTGTGGNNSRASPLFVDADGADNVLGTVDDRPRPGLGSPCIDSGHSMQVPAFISVDLLENQRFMDDPATPNTGVPNGMGLFVDKGAYEFVPVCLGDGNGDNMVNINDLNLVLGNFGQFGAPGIPGDVNEDGFVDINDLNMVLGNFGQSCP